MCEMIIYLFTKLENKLVKKLPYFPTLIIRSLVIMNSLNYRLPLLFILKASPDQNNFSYYSISLE